MPPSNYRVQKILRTLAEMFPTKIKTELQHETTFQLLVATILSAQCTDRQVNATTPALFQKFPTAHHFAEASPKIVEKLIHSTGFFRNKARNIIRCSQQLVSKYDGQVPNTLEELVQLPGVGRKTANVVLGAAFDIPGMVVDTHVKRISKLLGWTNSTDVLKIEQELMKIVPKKHWNKFSLKLIFLGRSHCPARHPRCPTCPLQKWCEHGKIVKKQSKE